jgi:ribosomal protein S18 acetylase RimI-like enzyme
VAQGVTVASRGARTRPLGDYRAEQLAPLLEAEAAHWSAELLWDYGEVTAAVAGGLDRRTLAGRVMELGSEPIAYCYYLQDGDRAIVGSLFAVACCQGQGYEEELLATVLADAQGDPAYRRVECQTLFSTAPAAAVEDRFAKAGFLGSPRHYMLRSLAEPLPEPCAGRLRRVRRSDLEALSEIIYASHVGSTDAALNTTYASRRHCRHFVETLVLRAGCGPFDAAASFVAEREGRPVGVLLASQLSPSNGHICQVSVEPGAQGEGLGRALVSAALRSFAEQGLGVSSLSVTVDNTRAYALYERLGFRLSRRFAAHAWARPPDRVVLTRR